MTFNPQTLRQLGTYWTDQGGVNLGVVGNAAHTYGYHLGRDRIFDGSGPGKGASDYSIQTARDKAGLSDAASAIDLGRLDRSLPNLYRFSRWLVAQCRANEPGTRDFREIIYSPDGERVLRGDRQRGYASAPRPGEADASHLTHTHISFYRDSEDRDKRPVFAPYFATPPQPEDDMPDISTYVPGQVATIGDPTGPANVRSAPSLTASLLRAIPKGQTETWTVTGWVKGEPSGGSDQWLTRWATGRWEYTAKGNVRAIAPPPDTTPFAQADLDAAYARGKAEGDVKQTVTVTISDGRPPTVITEV